MNKKEFIKRLIDMGGCGAKPETWARGWDDAIGEVIEIAEELDEPQKPVIPQFVADWYEENLSGGYTDNRNKFSGNDVFRVIQDVLKTSEGLKTWGDYGIDKEITAWAEENEEDFIHLIANCSYKDGYEVEKEKKYYVDLDTAAYVAKWNGDNQVGIYTDGISGSDEFEFHLTEKEIKDYDKRYWAFAEEVT